MPLKPASIWCWTSVGVPITISKPKWKASLILYNTHYTVNLSFYPAEPWCRVEMTLDLKQLRVCVCVCVCVFVRVPDGSMPWVLSVSDVALSFDWDWCPEKYPYVLFILFLFEKRIARRSFQWSYLTYCFPFYKNFSSFLFLAKCRVCGRAGAQVPDAADVGQHGPARLSFTAVVWPSEKKRRNQLPSSSTSSAAARLCLRNYTNESYAVTYFQKAVEMMSFVRESNWIQHCIWLQ